MKTLVINLIQLFNIIIRHAFYKKNDHWSWAIKPSEPTLKMYINTRKWKFLPSFLPIKPIVKTTVWTSEPLNISSQWTLWLSAHYIFIDIDNLNWIPYESINNMILAFSQRCQNPLKLILSCAQFLIFSLLTTYWICNEMLNINTFGLHSPFRWHFI